MLGKTGVIVFRVNSLSTRYHDEFAQAHQAGLFARRVASLPVAGGRLAIRLRFRLMAMGVALLGCA